MQIRHWQYKQRTYTLALARTAAQRTQGLSRSHRSDWAGLDGMYFEFPYAWYWPIWMRHTNFPLHILWLRKGRVIHEAHLHPSRFPHQITFPRQRADAVVELFVG